MRPFPFQYCVSNRRNFARSANFFYKMPKSESFIKATLSYIQTQRQSISIHSLFVSTVSYKNEQSKLNEGIFARVSKSRIQAVSRISIILVLFVELIISIDTP